MGHGWPPPWDGMLLFPSYGRRPVLFVRTRCPERYTLCPCHSIQSPFSGSLTMSKPLSGLKPLLCVGWLLGLALLFGGVAAAGEAEDKAIAFVKGLQGSVGRDDKAPGKPVVSVYLRATDVTDAGLKHLAVL